jgi:hypothetical protein
VEAVVLELSTQELHIAVAVHATMETGAQLAMVVQEEFVTLLQQEIVQMLILVP